MSMTVMITCDGCGLTAEESTQFDSGANEIETALDPGWIHNGGEDFCPACVAQGAGEQQ